MEPPVKGLYIIYITDFILTMDYNGFIFVSFHSKILALLVYRLVHALHTGERRVRPPHGVTSFFMIKFN